MNWCDTKYRLCVFLLLPEYMKLIAIFYWPALYYPLLACGTLHSKLGYVLGSLFSWTHFAVLFWQKIDCPKTPEVISSDI